MMRHASINNESPFATTYAQAGKKWVYEEKGKGKRIQARRTATQNVACLHLTRLSTYPPAKPPSAARRPVGRKKRERGKRACLQHRDGERRREKESLKHLNMATGRRGASSSPIALSAQSVKLCHTQVLLRKKGKKKKKRKRHIYLGSFCAFEVARSSESVCRSVRVGPGHRRPPPQIKKKSLARPLLQLSPCFRYSSAGSTFSAELDYDSRRQFWRHFHCQNCSNRGPLKSRKKVKTKDSPTIS